MKKLIRKISPKNWVIIGVICGILVLNMFKIRFNFDFIVLTMLLAAYVTGSSKRFIKDWFLPILLFYFYQAFRGSAYTISNKLWQAEPIVQPLITWERNLFFFLNDIPTVILQQTLRPDLSIVPWYDYVLMLFYTLFFWYWIGAGFMIWKKNRQLFFKYMYGLVGFSIFDTILYLFFPTAPPWYAAQQGLITFVPRLFWTTSYFKTSGMSIISGYGDNKFAAFPSHHAAWPFFASLFLYKAFGKKALPLMIVPIMIMFATWYGAEHYIIDSIAGILVAWVTYWFLNSKYFDLVWQKWKVASSK
ncbi:MAG: phosphatase PAP2 family protein [bacterium]